MELRNYVSLNVEYLIILKNLKKYGCHVLDPWTKVCHLLNFILCDKLSKGITTVRAYQINMRRIKCDILTSTYHPMSVKDGSVTQTKHAKKQKTSPAHSTFKEKIELKKYSIEEYDSMSIAQWQHFYELLHKTGLLKSKKTPQCSKALEARVAAIGAKIENRSNDRLFTDERPKASNINNPAFDREGSSIR